MTRNDRMNFKQLRDLAVKKNLPKIIARPKEVKRPACQQGKAIKSRSEQTNKIAKDQIVVTPGD